MSFPFGTRTTLRRLAAILPLACVLATGAAATAGEPAAAGDAASDTRLETGKGTAVMRPVHTYSIVARDPATGQLGAAVQSHWFSVGSLVLWARAGVGAVATQSFVDPSYGPLALALLEAGRSPEEALRGLVAADEGRAVRQVAVVDAQGRVAAHTGAGCIPAAGQHVGDGYSCQANLMEKDTVWDAMARAYESAEGAFAERLLAALEAAQAEGGDIRGKQSAAILIVAPESSGRVWEDRLVDLRVEDAPDPVRELGRLLELHRAYEHMNEGDLAVERGDADAARREYGAAEALAPGNLEMAYWHAVALANSGDLEESLPIFRRVFAGDANWAELTPRLVGVGLLTVSPEDLDRILAEAP